MVRLSLSTSPVFCRVFLMCAAVNFFGCTSVQEEIRVASDHPRPPPEAIDQDPWQLLPKGAVGLLRVDKEVWKADFGQDLAAAFVGHLPQPADVPFDPAMDVDLIVGAAYATVQNDVVFVCQGRFRPNDIAHAMSGSPKTRAGQAVTKITFAGETMYVSAPFAMVILTPKTMVLGTQLGVRRVLEVVEEGRMKRHLPAWYEALLARPGADLQLGVDLDADAVPAVLRTRLEFLNHLRAARLLGNYKGGGLNLAGSLTFDTPQAAAQAGQEISSADDQMEQFRLLLQTLGMPVLFKRIAAQATGKDAQFAVEVEGDAVSYFLKNLNQVSEQVFEPAP